MSFAYIVVILLLSIALNFAIVTAEEYFDDGYGDSDDFGEMDFDGTDPGAIEDMMAQMGMGGMGGMGGM
eukprot:CAMPEP_0204837006 /NCGR_PEP_ID=MMETSP1346-20131115/26873_1 /ASSEMBLY_ACC=CAM_ASM_000771 /TAXON_ID=215587 /ORGANISM="Aplanochytrium stocchinoi, Strain GSBS06" /LENGTH=68 /DNA_ID=CAMNT_0051972197 /DNA_START=19 /DNA_END=222 /DNA_ORIENTATION=+